jgi:hypothetical protein
MLVRYEGQRTPVTDLLSLFTKEASSNIADKPPLPLLSIALALSLPVIVSVCEVVVAAIVSHGSRAALVELIECSAFVWDRGSAKRSQQLSAKNCPAIVIGISLVQRSGN